MKKKITLFVITLLTNIIFSQTNLALSGTATASTETQVASNAIDGNSGTRWESEQKDIESWSVDLGSIYTIDHVIITWEGAFGSVYDIEVSTDNSIWASVYAETVGNGGTDDITFTATSARYVRYSGTSRGTPYGHSFYEFEVYESVNSTENASLSNLTVDGMTVSNFSSNTLIYDVVLPSGTTTVPAVVATTSEPSATTNTTDATSLPGTTTVLVTSSDSSTQNIYMINFTVEKVNLAENKTVVVSSENNASNIASNAVDGNTGTRWESEHTESEWIYIDLGASVDISGIQLNWEGAYADQYTIDVSLDASNWITVYTEVMGNGSIDDVTFTATSAQYVRMNGTSRGLGAFGYSLYEFEVYGNEVTSTWVGTMSSDWSTSGNWDNSTVPNALANAVIPSGASNNPVISSTTGVSVNDITIAVGASLIVNHGGSIIVNGTGSGDLTYQVNISNSNWHLVSSPVIGESYDNNWATANGIEISANDINRKAIGTYVRSTANNTGAWDYFTDASGTASGNFNTAQGYAIKRSIMGDVSFTGTIPFGDMSTTGLTVSDEGGANENKWNFVGNPYTAYIDVVSLLDDNLGKLDASNEALYVWNGASYEPITTGYVHPSQAFFININDNSVGVFSFKEDILSNQTGVSFYKNITPKVTLYVANDEEQVSTEIIYSEDKTTGLDTRFDLGRFTGEASTLTLYSHLVSDSKGVDFMKQALPQDYENLKIPIGVEASLNEVLTFTAKEVNLPEGIVVFLEDKVKGTYTNLSEANAAYSVIADDEVNGIGRFYLYTQNAKSLNVVDEILENVSIYKVDNTNIRITGLHGQQSFKLFNIMGKEVVDTRFNADGISDIVVPKIVAGVYLVKITNNTGVISKKIILN